MIDFYACYAEVTADALIGFCQVVKEETGGEKLAGAFFGYFMEIAWNNSFSITTMAIWRPAKSRPHSAAVIWA